MALPQINAPEYRHFLTGLGKEVRYRPFLVGEQKLILMARETEDPEAAQDIVKKIITNCTFGEVDPDTLAYFDVEDLFIRIRSKSISDILDIQYKWNYRGDDDKQYSRHIDVQINLDDVEVSHVEGHDKKIMVAENVGIMMKYPTLSTLALIDPKKGKDDFEAVYQCIDYIFDDKEMTHMSEVPKEVVEAWLDSLDLDAGKKIRQFFETMPTVRHTIEIAVPDDLPVADREPRKMELKGLRDFFG